MKVRAIGASNYSAPRLKAALETSAKHGLPRYETLQPHYNLADRGEFEGALQKLCVEESISVIPYYSLASGFLSGKYHSADDWVGKPRATSLDDAAVVTSGGVIVAIGKRGEVWIPDGSRVIDCTGKTIVAETLYDETPAATAKVVAVGRQATAGDIAVDASGRTHFLAVGPGAEIPVDGGFVAR